MNIKYHLACGIALDFTFGTKGIMTLFSVLPDAPLLLNEYRLFRDHKKFDPEDVPQWVLDGYFLTHSLHVWSLVTYLSRPAGIAYGVHIVADWFTHAGRFAAKPFYPHPYTMKFGKDILK
jgi:membrane-bound metal-dependent hydrolase YbcI (DUF457 family)